MAAQLPRPGIEVIQEFQSASPTIVTPTLVPCIVAPFFEVIEALNADGTVNSNAQLTDLYRQSAITIPQLSFPSPRGNISEVNVDEASIRYFLNIGGSLVEMSRTTGFLTDLNIATQAFVEGTATGPFAVDGQILLLQFDTHTAIGASLPDATSFPAGSDVQITFSGTALTIDQVVTQINAVVPGVASNSTVNPGQLRLTSTRWGAGSSVLVRSSGNANTALGFSAVTDQVAVGAGFFAVDDADGDTTSPRVEIFTGSTQRDITAANVAVLGSPPSFIDAFINTGDIVVADGVNIGEVDQVFASRLVMDTELSIFSQGGIKFAPRYLYVQAQNLTFPVSGSTTAASQTATAQAAAATRAFIVAQAALTAVGVAETMAVDVTIAGVAQPTENIGSGAGWADLAAAVAGINTSATNFEAYPANNVGDEVPSAIATRVGLRTLANNTGSGAAITLSSQSAGMTLGFSSLPVSDVGENQRYVNGTAPFAVAGSDWATLGATVLGQTVIYTPTLNGTAQAAETITWSAAHAGDAAGLAAAIADWNSQALYTQAYESNAAGVETTSGGYFAVRTVGESVGADTNINITGGTGVAAVGGIATVTGTDTDLNAATFQWRIDNNPQTYEVTFVADEDDGGTSIQSVVDAINVMTPSVASLSTSTPPALVLASQIQGEASQVTVVAGTANSIIGFTDNSTTTGNGRPAPDLAVDISGSALIQGQIIRDPLTGVPFPNATATQILAYRGLRLDVSPRAANPALVTITDSTQLGQIADPISTDNLGSGLAFLSLLNSPGSSLRAIGVPETSADAPNGTPVGYAECFTFLESEEVYAIALGTQEPTVIDAAIAHVDFMSLPANKGERIVFFNREIPTRAQPTLIGSGTDANTTATPGLVTVDVNIASALTAQGLDPSNLNPATGAVVNEIYLDLGGDDNLYLIQSVANGTDLTLRTTFATGENPTATWATTAPSNVISDSWTVAIRGAQLLVPGTTNADNTRVSETVQAIGQAYSNRRAFYTFPDQVGINITGLEQLVEGTYATAAIIGQVASQTPQQGFTNLPIVGLTQTVGSNRRFSEPQLNVMAAGGVYILVQDAVGSPVISRHQLSTSLASIESRELSITKVVDFTAKFIRSGLRRFIGRVNITQPFLDQLSTILEGFLSFLRERGVLIGANVNSVLQDASQPDTVLVDITLDVPFPANYIRVTLVV